MKRQIPQFELPVCTDSSSLEGESCGIDTARRAAEALEAARCAREAKAWQEKMQRKLAECPGFIGCDPPGQLSPGMVTVHPSAAGEAFEFLRRRFHLGQVGWRKGLGLTIQILPRRKGTRTAAARRNLAPVEQFRFTFDELRVTHHDGPG